jgi:hypothetical protein
VVLLEDVEHCLMSVEEAMRKMDLLLQAAIKKGVSVSNREAFEGDKTVSSQAKRAIDVVPASWGSCRRKCRSEDKKK